MPETESEAVESFIERWKASGGSESANSQPFLNDLCDLLGIPRPDEKQSDESKNRYVFEKPVDFNNGDGTTSLGKIDLFYDGRFILESKQGSEDKVAKLAEALATKTKQKKFGVGIGKRGTPAWARVMVKARQQAKRYAEAVTGEWPPFLIVVDVGHCFDLYADFSQTGKQYGPFPDPSSYRVALDNLRDVETRERLRAIWLDPLSLDPARRSAKVTRDVADRLAKLAKSLEQEHGADVVAQFLMRCLFTMFAEDVEVGGLNKGDFTEFLRARRAKLDSFVPMLESLWQTMNTGGFSVVLEGTLKQFNGGLFEDQRALPLTDDQLELLIEAAEAEWNNVEPAIFGTLLERALNPVERHKLGAHYTPREYVERLVLPTIIEPLREEWQSVYATAVQLEKGGKRKQAVSELLGFHRKLCNIRVLDPACGSGNFLYVSLELMKRLEGEVLIELAARGEPPNPTLTIDPHQFLGIEVNPRAAAIADLVLWIGYLQWHIRTRGNDPLNEPIIRKFNNIECRDAVLDCDAIEPVVDENGNPATGWDGRTTKAHPVTGEEVPDEAARVQQMRYIAPRKAEWPEAEFIVGNPPFVGSKQMRDTLGDHYVTALHKAFPQVPASVDYVMYWWNEAAVRVTKKNPVAIRFGFITTNSIHQFYNRKLLRLWMSADRLALDYAIPDHPWTDTQFCASVRIAMTVGMQNSDHSHIAPGQLAIVASETRTAHPRNNADSDTRGTHLTTKQGVLTPSLTIGVDTRDVTPLMSNSELCWQGCKLVGSEFQITPELASQFVRNSPDSAQFLREYWAGRDVTRKRKRRFVIDFFGLTEAESRQGNRTLNR